MKIIRTPLDWNSAPDDNWLHSVDYIETADIDVDELESSARTGTVTFTQDESSNEEQVTVIQKRKTFYYSVGTNCGDGTEFRIGGQLVASEDGVATRISTLGDASPETMVAVPKYDIRSLEVSEPSVEFPSSGGSIDEEFTWINWDKTGTTLPRWSNNTPQDFINSASTSIPSVGSVSGPSWLTVDVDGHITASENAGNERSGTVQYSYCGKTATVHVIQKKKVIPPTMYFAVKTTSTLAQGKRMTFTVNGVDVDKDFEVGAGACEGYFTASTSATSGSEVSASCNFSYTMMTAVPSALTFASTGETLTVDVDAGTKSLIVDHQPLTGYTNLDSASKFYTIEESTITGVYSSKIVPGSDEGFSISANSITASSNTTHSTRTGKAKFTLATDTAYTATVTLNQPNVNWFSFESTVSGSPNAGKVIFSNLPAPYPSSETIRYTQQTGDTQYLERTYTGNVQQISYKIEGFDETASISVSRDYVKFSGITMQLVGDPLDGGRYHLSGATEEVTVTANGVSYNYQEKINEEFVTPPSLTGVIPANSKLEFNATASTANDFTITKTYNNSTSGDWECNVATGTPATITVKTTAPIPVTGQKILTLKYALDEAPQITAQTKFEVPSGVTSGINFNNFALRSKTAFGEALKSGSVPSGASAYTFAFWPPSRYPMGSADDLRQIHYADIRYVSCEGGGECGWMLYYPYNLEDTSGNTNFSNFAAKIYAVTYGNDIVPQSVNFGAQDAWTLGPLVYRDEQSIVSGICFYCEVDGFNFLPGFTGNAQPSDKTELVVCKTNEERSNGSKFYPHKCPFTGTSALSDSSQYFKLITPQSSTGGSAATSATSGVISDDKRTWTVSGQAQGGIQNTSSFFNRIGPTRSRNYPFIFSPTGTNCNPSPPLSPYFDTPEAMAHAVSGYVQTNLLGRIKMKMIYLGKTHGDPDFGNITTWHVPADSYIVTPRNPGDTTSVIYDAETNTYLIYDIENVIVLHKQDYTVVPEIDLEEFKTPIEGEIIGPPHP